MPIVQIRLDDQIKDDAVMVLDRMGLTLSEAVRMFLVRVVADQAIPFRTKVPHAATGASMEPARRPPRVSRRPTALEELEQEVAAKPSP